MNVMTGLVIITAILCGTLLAMAWIGSKKK
jgi:hypothetical protein